MKTRNIFKNITLNNKSPDTGLTLHWLNLDIVWVTGLRSSTNQMTADLLMLYGFYSFQKFKISEFYSFLMPVEEKVLPNCIVSGVVALSGIPS